MKKISFLLALVALFMLATAGVAYANFGPHGGYSQDTDACAGCHRAHTSFSEVTWKDDAVGDSHSALLVSSATTMQEFCYACHGDNAPGASTNVESGIFDSGPSGEAGEPLGGAILYQTNSTFGDVLNGGGFDSLDAATTTSMHNMVEGAGAIDPMWGYQTSVNDAGAQMTSFTCTDCHDPHGSANYRLLKDYLNGVRVGGYDDIDGQDPTPQVVSAEIGYPSIGWRKHDPGAAQMAGYRPNYTFPEYQVGAAQPSLPDPRSTMSSWCSACHTQYNQNASQYDYDGYMAVDANRTAGVLNEGVGAQVGVRTFHRHPVGTAPASFEIMKAGDILTTDTVIPLEKKSSWEGNGEPRDGWDKNDTLSCLTCHRAHGTAAVMTGFAEAKLAQRATAPTWTVEPLVQPAGNSGVNPNFSSALLRADNRGVCERCHNK